MGGSWGYVGPFFALFAHFEGFLDASYAILVFWDALFWIFIDFLSIWDGFREDFGMVFRWFFVFLLKIAILLKSLFFLQKIAIFKDSTLQKSIKNPSKIHANFVWENEIKKMPKKWIWDGLGLHLGGVWGGLGTLWAILGRLLLVFDVQN